MRTPDELAAILVPLPVRAAVVGVAQAIGAGARGKRGVKALWLRRDEVLFGMSGAAAVALAHAERRHARQKGTAFVVQPDMAVLVALAAAAAGKGAGSSQPAASKAPVGLLNAPAALTAEGHKAGKPVSALACLSRLTGFPGVARPGSGFVQARVRIPRKEPSEAKADKATTAAASKETPRKQKLLQ
jgi:hypothetical protein